MADPKLDVLVENYGAPGPMKIVWADRHLEQQLKAIKGIAAVYWQACFNRFVISVDPRFSVAEVVAEIESIGYSLPDAFKELEV